MIYFMDGPGCMAGVKRSFPAPPGVPENDPFVYWVDTRYNSNIVHGESESIEAATDRVTVLLRDFHGMETSDDGRYRELRRIKGWTRSKEAIATLKALRL